MPGTENRKPKIDLFDCFAGATGLGSRQREHLPIDDLLGQMQRLDVGGALIRTWPVEVERNWPSANRALYETCAAHDGLVPCPVLIPATARDVPPESEQVATALEAGAGAAWIRPRGNNWPAVDWVCGALLRELNAHRLPVYITEPDLPPDPAGHAQRGEPLLVVADLAKAYPELPFLLAGFDYRTMRTILPLLRTFPNVHLTTGYNFAMHRGLEFLVDEIGPDRILFGTGFPISEPAMYVTQLMYADLPDAARAAVASGNANRLLEGIRR
jgi:predicted TIM-barrel fold metal-dependent hydrolase